MWLEDISIRWGDAFVFITEKPCAASVWLITVCVVSSAGNEKHTARFDQRTVRKQINNKSVNSLMGHKNAINNKSRRLRARLLRFVSRAEKKQKASRW